jgi:hypothetical protein
MLRRALPMLIFAATSACIPTAARQNARLESGVDLSVTGGAALLLEGEDENGDKTDTIALPYYAEIDLQAAWTDEEDQSGFALQVKVPITIVLASLDAYWQMPSRSKGVYYGLGIEIGSIYGAYGVYTKYISERTFLSFTGRLLSNYASSARETDREFAAINPQLSIGMSGPVELSAFISYSYHTGDGLNIDFDLCIDECDEDVDLRKNLLLTGVSARF